MSVVPLGSNRVFEDVSNWYIPVLLIVSLIEPSDVNAVGSSMHEEKEMTLWNKKKKAGKAGVSENIVHTFYQMRVVVVIKDKKKVFFVEGLHILL